jgi:HAD superfamily hydrolase (TIGR01509 family)
MGLIRAVILDVDGTLLLSNEAHARAFVEAAAQLGFPGAPYEEILRMIGMGGDKLIPLAFGFSAESGSGQRLDERKGEIFRERFAPRLEPTPGARDLLERLRADGLGRVVATSANEEDLQILLRRAGVEDLIEACTSSSDVDRSKPDPDVVEQALELAGEPAERVVMIGDTPYDVEAASRAGVSIIGVRTGGWDEQALTGAAAVYDDPADLLRRYGESVFA